MREGEAGREEGIDVESVWKGGTREGGREERREGGRTYLELFQFFIDGCFGQLGHLRGHGEGGTRTLLGYVREGTREGRREGRRERGRGGHTCRSFIRSRNLASNASLSSFSIPSS